MLDGCAVAPSTDPTHVEVLVILFPAFDAWEPNIGGFAAAGTVGCAGVVGVAAVAPEAEERRFIGASHSGPG